MIPILNPSEIKQIEKNIDGDSKNKNLQKIAVDKVTKYLFNLNPSKLIIFIGAGLNGEDGILIGSQLSKNNFKGKIQYFSSISKNSNTNNFNLAKKLEIELLEISEDELSKANTKDIVILDCILGISTKMPMRSDISKNLKIINKFSTKNNAKIISLDVPSGFDPLNGLSDLNTLNSSHIIFLGYQTIGTLNDPSLFISTSYVDFGINEKDLAQVNINSPQAVDAHYVKNIYPNRPNNLYKSKFGSHLIIGGSERFPGAAILSSKSSNISGTGHTSISSPANIVEKIIRDTPEVTHYPVNHQGYFSNEFLSKFDCISIGVGMDLTKESKKLIYDFVNYLENTDNKHDLVLDADALNIISEIDNWWEKFPKSTLITPHLGEYERLFKVKKGNITLESVVCNANKTGINILLKGPNTIIAAPNKRPKVTTLSNGGMSKPGMGDVLTGIIGSLSSNKDIEVDNAAIIGSYVHSQSGLLAKQTFGSTSMTATNVISFIPQVFKTIE